MYLYLAMSRWATDLILIREEAETQHLVYYTSKALLDAEIRYSMMEKLALALVTTSLKLRPYF